MRDQCRVVSFSFVCFCYAGTDVGFTAEDEKYRIGSHDWRMKTEMERNRVFKFPWDALELF